MNKLLHILFLGVAAIFALSCGSTPEDVAEGCLLSVGSVEIGTTKAVISEDSFPQASEESVGLFLKASDGVSEYAGDGSGYNNVRCTKAASSSVWDISTPMFLTKSTGTLFAYYPYDADALNIAGIPLRSSINGADYMYAVPSVGISSENATADLVMKHAMAMVSITFRKDAAYNSGDCELTGLSISGACVAPDGTMDARDGSISAVSSEVVFAGFGHKISESGITEDVLLVSTISSEKSQSLDVSCVIDGQSYSISFVPQVDGNGGVVIRQGFRSTITLSVKGRSLYLDEVTVSEWNKADGSSSGTGIDGSGIYTIDAEHGEYGGDIEM